MKKKYLINYLQKKIDYKKNSKIIFKNEYLLNYFSKKQRSQFDCSYLEDLNEVYNKDKDELFIVKKVSKYRSFLKDNLNKIHQVNFSENEWGLLLDYYLIISIISIRRKIKTYKKIKNKKIFINVISGDFYFKDTKSIYEELSFGTSVNKFLDYIIFKELKFKNLNVSNQKLKYRSYKNKKKSISLNTLLLNIIIKIFKPNIIIDGYFGVLRSIQIMFLSKFKILFLKEKFLNTPNKFSRKNNHLRKKLIIPENDSFDKIFNEYNKEIFPSSFLENFKSFFYSNKKFSEGFKSIGTAILLHISDNFKFITLNVKKRGGKIVSFQHGGLFGMRKFSPEDYIIQKYADIKFNWDDKNGIGAPYFYKKSKIIKKKNGLLFFPSPTLFQEMTENLKECNHLYLNKYWKLYELINDDKKKEIKIKFFNLPVKKTLKKLWIENTNNKIRFEEKNYKGNIFSNFRITVIDNFSTALFELIYYSEPFIIISNSKQKEFTKEFRKTLNYLKSLNILFDSEKKAADFINNNYNDFESWWNKILKKRKFKIIKKRLFPIEEFNNSKFVNNFTQKLVEGDVKIS